jgi:hypothetical protein
MIMGIGPITPSPVEPRASSVHGKECEHAILSPDAGPFYYLASALHTSILQQFASGHPEDILEKLAVFQDVV